MKDLDLQAGGAYPLEEYYVRKGKFTIRLRDVWEAMDNRMPWHDPPTDYRLDAAGQDWFAWVPFDGEGPGDVAAALRQMADALDKLERKNPQSETEG